MPVEHHAPRVHDSVGKIFRARERAGLFHAMVDRSPRTLRTAFVLSSWRYCVWKWAEAKKPIHRFLDRVPLQMSSRRRRNASFWRPEIVLVVSLRKRVNAGKFRTRSQTGHNLLVPDDLSPSDFSSISESFILLEILIHWCVTKIGRNDQKKEYHIILYNRLPSIYKILEFFGNARMMDR